MKRRVVILIATAAILLIVVGVTAYRSWNTRRLPAEAAQILRSANTIELFSLQPGIRREPDTEQRPEFHSWPVLGRTEISDAATRREILAALRDGIAENDGTVAGCFNPRHGIRAEHDGQVVDLVICFECMSLQVFDGDERVESVLVTPSPQPAFDAVLKNAGVQLAGKQR